jgi:anti-sigma factor RsiW
MTDPLRPPTPRPELLAAYIDGELDPATAARVEAWLLTDPHACELLDEQYLLSPSHREFWRAVTPARTLSRPLEPSVQPNRQTPPAAAGFPRSTLALPPHPTAYAGSPLVVHHQR